MWFLQGLQGGFGMILKFSFGFPKGFEREVSFGFPKGFQASFRKVSARFPQGFPGFPRGFPSIFHRVSAGFPKGFRTKKTVRKSSETIGNPLKNSVARTY